MKKIGRAVFGVMAGCAAIAVILCGGCSDDGIYTALRKARYALTVNESPLNSGSVLIGCPACSVVREEVYYDGYGSGYVDIICVPGGPIYGPDDVPRYPAETSFTLTAYAATGYVFSHWTGASNSTSASITITMNGNKTLTANFVPRNYGTLTDSRDGKRYKTVAIGNQTWMAENLNYDTANGTGSWCYDNDNSNCAQYGRLYDWNTATAGSFASAENPIGVQGICPSGWHLPSRAEWETLAAEIGEDNDGYYRYESGLVSWWYDYDKKLKYGIDKYGFSVLPGGSRSPDGSFNNPDYRGYWWTATESGASFAYYRNIHYNYNYDYYYVYVYEFAGNKGLGSSVRCVAGDGTPTKPEAKYTVTFDGNGATTGVPDAAVDMDSGTVITLPDHQSMEKAGHSFRGWNTKDDGTEDEYPANYSYTVTQNITLYAVWIERKYNLAVVVSPSNGGTVSVIPSKANYDHGEIVTVTAIPASNYTFTGWTGAVTSSNASISVAMGSDMTLTASFETVWGTVTDSRDGKTYNTVRIGNQRWMAENLNFQVDSSWCYRDSGSYCAAYGRLYDWNTAMAACPSSWHLPSRDEWGALAIAAGGELAIAVGGPATYGTGGTAGRKLKSTTGWNYYSDSYYGTDEYGFSALPGGSRTTGGYFYDAGNNGLWWTATDYGASRAYYRVMRYDYDFVFEYTYSKEYGFAVRCVQD